jgi:hypothetical protein
MPEKPFYRKFDGWWYVQLRQPVCASVSVSLPSDRRQRSYRAGLRTR